MTKNLLSLYDDPLDFDYEGMMDYCPFKDSEMLDLSFEHYDDLPDSLFQHLLLRSLTMHGCSLKYLSKSISNLPLLEELDLSDNFQLQTISPEISKLKKLWRLDLEGNRLETLPDSFAELSALRFLYLHRNQLKSLPENFGQLQELRRLSLYSNPIQVLPDSFRLLKKLKDLYLPKISLFPEPILDLSALLYLSIGAPLNEAIYRLQSLVGLKVNKTEMDSLPEELGLLSHLQELSLQWNQLKTVPSGLGRLQNLKILDLADNQITHLPKSLGQLSPLEVLWLGENQLNEVPEFISQLSNIKMLGLSGNPITALPTSLNKLKQLERLYLDLPLKKQPQILPHFPRLQFLSLNLDSFDPSQLSQFPKLQELVLYQDKDLNTIDYDGIQKYILKQNPELKLSICKRR